MSWRSYQSLKVGDEVLTLVGGLEGVIDKRDGHRLYLSPVSGDPTVFACVTDIEHVVAADPTKVLNAVNHYLAVKNGRPGSADLYAHFHAKYSQPASWTAGRWEPWPKKTLATVEANCDQLREERDYWRTRAEKAEGRAHELRRQRRDPAFWSVLTVEEIENALRPLADKKKLDAAKAANVCRICGEYAGPLRRADGTVNTFKLNYGKEFAHADCIKAEEKFGRYSATRTAAEVEQIFRKALEWQKRAEEAKAGREDLRTLRIQLESQIDGLTGELEAANRRIDELEARAAVPQHRLGWVGLIVANAIDARFQYRVLDAKHDDKGELILLVRQTEGEHPAQFWSPARNFRQAPDATA